MLTIEVEIENDNRWLAEVLELPGVLAYGQNRAEAILKVKILAMQVLTERIEHGEQSQHVRGLFKEEVSI